MQRLEVVLTPIGGPVWWECVLEGRGSHHVYR